MLPLDPWRGTATVKCHKKRIVDHLAPYEDGAVGIITKAVVNSSGIRNGCILTRRNIRHEHGMLTATHDGQITKDGKVVKHARYFANPATGSNNNFPA